MSDYITSITSVSANEGSSKNSGQKYEFEIPLTSAQVQNLATEPLKIDFSYFVKSDKALEKLGDQLQYANYKVILTAHLANKSGTALIEDVSDYLIYTNAKFYNGIISTRDFDSESERKYPLQDRYAIGGYIYEFPAGLVEPNEEFHEGAVRQMYEETGLKFTPLKVDPAFEKPYFTTVGMTDESCATVYGYAEGEIIKLPVVYKHYKKYKWIKNLT